MEGSVNNNWYAEYRILQAVTLGKNDKPLKPFEIKWVVVAEGMSIDHIDKIIKKLRRNCNKAVKYKVEQRSVQSWHDMENPS